MKITLRTFAFFMLLVIAGSKNSFAQNSNSPAYKPDDIALYNTIAKMDSLFFHAYNTCDMETQAAFYDDSVEFYHDKSGLSTSKKDLLDATKRNICGKITRTMIPGTLEVYPINNYGAIEMAMHEFHNSAEPNAVPHPSKFIVIWKLNSNGKWTLKRVVSLH